MSEKENENGLEEQSNGLKKGIDTIKKKYDRVVRYFRPNENLMVDGYSSSMEKSETNQTVREAKAQKEAAIEAAEESKSSKFRAVRTLSIKRKPHEVVEPKSQENDVDTLANVSNSPEVGEDNSSKYRFVGPRKKKEKTVINISNGENGIDTRIPLDSTDKTINIIINNANYVERENRDRERRMQALGRLGRLAVGTLVVLTTIGCLRSCAGSEIQEEQTVPVLPETSVTEVLGAREEVQNPGNLLYGMVQAMAQEEMTDAEIKGVLAIQNTQLYNWQEQETSQETSFDLAEEFETVKAALADAEARLDKATTTEEKQEVLEEITMLNQTMSNMYVSYEDFVLECADNFYEAANASPDVIMDRESVRVDALVENYQAEMDKCNRNVELSTVAEAYLDIGVDVNVEYGENGVGVYTYEVDTITQTLGKEEEQVVEQETTPEKEAVIDDSQLKDVAESRGRTFEDYARSAGETIAKVADKTYKVAKAFGDGLLNQTDDRDE